MSNWQTIGTMIKNLKESIGDRGANKLAKALIDYHEAEKIYKEMPLWQFGLPSDETLLKTIIKIKEDPAVQETAVRGVAEQYIENFQKAKKHNERRDTLERALNLLIDINRMRQGDLKASTLALIAWIYLLRSRIIHPKGRTIPEKKKGAVKKGIEFIEKAISKTPSDLAILKLKGELYLELERIGGKRGEEASLKEVLKQALPTGAERLEKFIDVKIATRYSEMQRSDDQFLNQIIESKLGDIELEKARACRLRNDEGGILNNMKGIKKSLQSKYFSDPYWDDTVNFLKDLREDNRKEYWKRLTLDVYEICKEKEEETANLHLRWYWSRQRDLYDLAFLAADSIEEKARIADSLKSRPALQWGGWEELCKQDIKYKETYENILENAAAALAGGYIKGLDKGSLKLPGGSGQLSDEIDITEIPKGSIAVHLYLNQLEGKGYALVYDGDSAKWAVSDFEFKGLFDAFLTWQTNYSRTKSQSAGSLVTLCKKIGESMPFLFDLSPDKRVLFISHDFIHRLPLHGAINHSDEVFLEKHPCCYLPAWSLASPKQGTKPQGRILLKYFDKYAFPQLNQIPWTSPPKDQASADDFRAICSPPGLIVILCHGKADAANPFNAKLKLLGKGLTHLEILRSDVNLNGSSVVLGACETDLVPPLSTPLDEHLSISTALLSKGALHVLGTMWEVKVARIEQVMALYEQGEMDWVSKITNWQKEQILKWREKNNSLILYDAIAFRVLGCSVNQG